MKHTDMTETYDAFDVAMITIMSNLHRSFSNGPVEQEPWWPEIVALRKIVATGERKECAVIAGNSYPPEDSTQHYRDGWDDAAETIAAAIRARGGE